MPPNFLFAATGAKLLKGLQCCFLHLILFKETDAQTVAFQRFCKRWPFAFQKATFRTVKDRLLQRERPPFAKRPETADATVCTSDFVLFC